MSVLIWIKTVLHCKNFLKKLILKLEMCPGDTDALAVANIAYSLKPKTAYFMNKGQ